MYLDSITDLLDLSKPSRHRLSAAQAGLNAAPLSEIRNGSAIDYIDTTTGLSIICAEATATPKVRNPFCGWLPSRQEMESWVGNAEPPLSLDLPTGEDGDVTLSDFILDDEIKPGRIAGPTTGPPRD